MKKLAACIIETRPVDLIGAIEEHLKFLPEDTDLFVSNGPLNQIVKAKYPLVTFIPTDVADIHAYNNLLTSASFWVQFFKYSRVLIFQTDSKLLRKGIEEFYEWDYVGANWLWDASHCGNGGLSLRNPKTMFDVCIKYPHDTFMNEDVYFSNILHKHPELGQLAPIEVADRFSIEAKFTLGSLGCHAIEKYLTQAQCFDVLHQYEKVQNNK